MVALGRAASDKVDGLPPEHALAGGIDAAHHEICIEGDDRIAGTGDDRLLLRNRPVQPRGHRLAFAVVAHVALDHVTPVSAVGAEDKLRADDATVLGDQRLIVEPKLVTLSERDEVGTAVLLITEGLGKDAQLPHPFANHLHA